MNFLDFISQFDAGLNTAERFRARSAHKSVLHSLETFCDGRIPSLKVIYTRDFLQRYERFLRQSNCQGNTISFYMTILRSIYSMAVERKHVPYTHNLFSCVFTGNAPTKKRALVPEQIARIYSADLSGVPRLQRCRDWFILSFLFQGMPFCDLAYLYKSCLHGNIISYRRQKTQTEVNVPVLPEAREILERYMIETENSPYLLPLLTKTGEEGYKQYQTVIHRHNRHLKDLAAFIGLEEVLTSYVSRHSWATIAYHNGVYVSVVSQALGHHTEEITRIYLDSFEYQEIYKANQTVLSAILSHIRKEEVPQPQEAEATETPEREEESGMVATLLRNSNHRSDIWRSPIYKKGKQHLGVKRKRT